MGAPMKKILRIFLCAALLLAASTAGAFDNFPLRSNLHLSPKLNRSMLQAETVAYYDLVGWSGVSASTITTLDNNIRLVKFGSGITLASVTAKLSLVSPRLVTQSSVDLRPYAMIPGASFSFSDGTKSAVFSGGSAGTGETLGAELTTGWTSNAPYPYETFSSAGKNIDSAIGDSSHAIMRAYATALANPAGKLYKNETTITLNSGSGPDFYYHALSDLAGAGIVTAKAYVNGINTTYFTGTSAQYTGFRTNADIATNYSAVWSNKQVLTADTTGANFSAVTDGGVNPNIATWTVTITKP